MFSQWVEHTTNSPMGMPIHKIDRGKRCSMGSCLSTCSFWLQTWLMSHVSSCSFQILSLWFCCSSWPPAGGYTLRQSLSGRMHPRECSQKLVRCNMLIFWAIKLDTDRFDQDKITQNFCDLSFEVHPVHWYWLDLVKGRGKIPENNISGDNCTTTMFSSGFHPWLSSGRDVCCWRMWAYCIYS